MPPLHPIPPWRSENAILSALPPHELSRLRPRLTRISVRAGDSLQEPDSPSARVLFVEQGILTLHSLAERPGRSVGVALVGRESAAGLLGTLQPHRRSITQIVAQTRAIVHSAPTAGLLDPGAAPGLATFIHLHIELIVAQLVVAAACASQHTTPQRLARLLLMTEDRSDGATISYTQHALAGMLGVRRASINTALARLEARDAIVTSRGHVRIRDTLRLRHAACFCYGRLQRLTTQASTQAVLPAPALDRSGMETGSPAR